MVARRDGQTSGMCPSTFGTASRNRKHKLNNTCNNNIITPCDAHQYGVDLTPPPLSLPTAALYWATLLLPPQPGAAARPRRSSWELPALQEPITPNMPVLPFAVLQKPFVPTTAFETAVPFAMFRP